MDKFSPGFLYYFLVNLSILPFLVLLIKLSILLLYQRLFSSSKKMMIAIYLTAFFVFGYNIAGFFTTVFRCTPRAKAWDLRITTGACHNHDWLLIFFGVLNVITDFAVLILPLPIVWSLHLPRRQKLALMALFMTGAFACIVSIVKLRVYIAIYHARDFTWVLVSSASWDVVEVNVGIVCACMACLRPLLQKVVPGGYSLSRSRQSKNALDRSTSPAGTATASATSKRSHPAPPWPLPPSAAAADRSYIELGDAPRGTRDASLPSERMEAVRHGSRGGGGAGGGAALDRRPLAYAAHRLDHDLTLDLEGGIIKTIGVAVEG
ncbi:MAG: hypothetical protein M1826_007464 [Phylliscum demangeonii]|nr:MAG: hypothetical protein M1826_007464 [Phylliscum demangeonii]